MSAANDFLTYWSRKKDQPTVEVPRPVAMELKPDPVEVGRAALGRMDDAGACLVTVGGFRGVAIKTENYTAEFRQDLRVLGLEHLCVFSLEWEYVRRLLGLPPLTPRLHDRKGGVT